MSREQERIYLSKRKGFVKVAMQAGADIVPVYILGQSQASSQHCWLVVTAKQTNAGVARCSYAAGALSYTCIVSSVMSAKS